MHYIGNREWFQTPPNGKTPKREDMNLLCSRLAPSIAFQAEDELYLLSLLTWWRLEWRRTHATEASMPSSHSSKASIDVWIYSTFCFFSSNNKIGTTNRWYGELPELKNVAMLPWCAGGKQKRSEHLGPLEPWNSNIMHHVALCAAQENQPELSCGGFLDRMFQVGCTLIHEPAF